MVLFVLLEATVDVPPDEAAKGRVVVENKVGTTWERRRTFLLLVAAMTAVLKVFLLVLLFMFIYIIYIYIYILMYVICWLLLSVSLRD
jgi:hypothetical protein